MAVSMAQSKGLLRTMWKQISSTLVLVVLSSIAIWGHITHWQIGGHAHAADGAHDEATADSHAPASPGAEHAAPAANSPEAPGPAATPASPDALARVKFDSAEGVRRAGIQTLAVKEQALDEYVEGPSSSVSAAQTVTWPLLRSSVARARVAAPSVRW